MVYSDFSLIAVKKKLGLKEKTINLFPKVSQSEFIIMPILLELEKRNAHQFSIFSGERLDVDEEQGLKGKCDFILSKGPISVTIQAPIFSLVEAKKNDIKEGLGQCTAQMLGAYRFNQQEEQMTGCIYGCVTIGEDWQFLKLEDQVIFIDSQRYYLSERDKILWILQQIVESFH